MYFTSAPTPDFVCETYVELTGLNHLANNTVSYCVDSGIYMRFVGNEWTEISGRSHSSYVTDRKIEQSLNFSTSGFITTQAFNIFSGKMDIVSGSSMMDGAINNIYGTTTGVSARIIVDTYNNSNTFGSSYRGRRFRGDMQNPSGAIKDDVLLQLAGDGHDGSVIAPAKASIAFFAAEDFKTGAHGTFIRVRTTPTGTDTALERVIVTENGNVGINQPSPQHKLDVSGDGNFSSLFVNNSPVLPVSKITTGEILVGTIDGVNRTFVTSNDFYLNSINLFLNGLQLLPSHFEVLGPNQIRLDDAPFAGDTVSANYMFIN